MRARARHVHSVFPDRCSILSCPVVLCPYFAIWLDDACHCHPDFTSATRSFKMFHVLFYSVCVCPTPFVVHSKLSSGYGHHARSHGTRREYDSPRVRLEPREALTRAYGEAALTPPPRPILRWSQPRWTHTGPDAGRGGRDETHARTHTSSRGHTR